MISCVISALTILFWILQSADGAIVHPWGVEQSFRDAVEALRKCYGYKQGKPFCIWIDRISEQQISSGTYTVKFRKWELFGKCHSACRNINMLFPILLLNFVLHFHDIRILLHLDFWNFIWYNLTLLVGVPVVICIPVKTVLSIFFSQLVVCLMLLVSIFLERW